MSNDLNTIIIIGRITKDIELKYLQKGTAIVNFSIANNRKYQDKEEVNYFDITAYGKLAEVIAEYCKKGKQIAIEGRLQQRRWEQDSNKRSKIEIVADNIQFLDSKKPEGNILESGTDNPFKDDIPF